MNAPVCGTRKERARSLEIYPPPGAWYMLHIQQYRPLVQPVISKDLAPFLRVPHTGCFMGG